MSCSFFPLIPLENRPKLTSRYGLRPGRVTRQIRQHAGLDISSEPRVGAPVLAVAPGIVEVVGLDSERGRAFNGYGNCVAIRHELSWLGHSPIWTFAAHLSELLVGDGDRIVGGQHVGRTGNTSNGKFAGMGPHCHFELRHASASGGTPYPGPYARYNLDPEPWLASGGITFGRDGYLLWAPTEGLCLPERPSILAVTEPWRLFFDLGRRA